MANIVERFPTQFLAHLIDKIEKTKHSFKKNSLVIKVISSTLVEATEKGLLPVIEVQFCCSSATAHRNLYSWCGTAQAIGALPPGNINHVINIVEARLLLFN
ncbi:hypothetical protein NPIL_427851 [Nephila pilipes]|uniref:Uncharacterized protein n=1 Tax=Nephila pilipes TaxID=299642 RepID=A0A8X6U4R5_NEPPI|nr:hypothetical protein NPIL_427851 [Nephila pilipes]